MGDRPRWVGYQLQGDGDLGPDFGKGCLFARVGESPCFRPQVPEFWTWTPTSPRTGRHRVVLPRGDGKAGNFDPTLSSTPSHTLFCFGRTKEGNRPIREGRRARDPAFLLSQ